MGLFSKKETSKDGFAATNTILKDMIEYDANSKQMRVAENCVKLSKNIPFAIGDVMGYSITINNDEVYRKNVGATMAGAAMPEINPKTAIKSVAIVFHMRDLDKPRIRVPFATAGLGGASAKLAVTQARTTMDKLDIIFN